MKRVAILLAMVVVVFPTSLLAQKNNTIQGSMAITSTTIIHHEKEKKEKKEKPEKVKKPKKVLAPIKSGWQQSIEVASGLDFGDDWLFDVGVNYIGGYRAGSHFFIGFQTGLNVTVYDDASYYEYNPSESRYCPAPSMVMIPLSLHLRTYLTKTKCQPYFALSGGAKFGLKRPTCTIYDEDLFHDTDGEPYTQETITTIPYSPINYNAELAFGLSFRASNRSSIYLQWGGLFQFRTYYKRISPYQGSLSRRPTAGLSIKLGCTF